VADQKNRQMMVRKFILISLAISRGSRSSENIWISVVLARFILVSQSQLCVLSYSSPTGCKVVLICISLMTNEHLYTYSVAIFFSEEISFQTLGSFFDWVIFPFLLH
jgi:hypothetical protein